MDPKSETPTPEMPESKGTTAERWVQILIATIYLGWVAYTEHVSTVKISDMSFLEVAFLIGKYTFAGLVISGVTPREAIQGLKAWKEK